MIGERNSEVAAMALRLVERDPQQHGCLAEHQQATSRLDREGFWWRPTWQALLCGARPPENVVGEPGEWRHGWHFCASSISDTHFRERSILSARAAAGQAHLRSTGVHDPSSPVPGSLVGETAVATTCL